MTTTAAPVDGANKNGKPPPVVGTANDGTTNDGATQHDAQEERIGKHAVHRLASLFLRGGEYQALVDGIKKGGQQLAIVLDQNGFVVDGRNRYRALVELGIEPNFETREFENDDDLTRYLVNANIVRRHLNAVQRAFLAARLQETLRPQALENQTSGGAANLAGGDTRDIAAALVGGVSHTNVDVARRAIEANPEIEELVKTGQVTLMREVSQRLKDAPGAIPSEEIKTPDETRAETEGAKRKADRAERERQEQAKRKRQSASSDFVGGIVGAWSEELREDCLLYDDDDNEIDLPPIGELADAFIGRAYPAPFWSAKDSLQHFEKDIKSLEQLLKFLPKLIKELKAKLPKEAPVA
jgi:ParB-like chromosome segregation protein Spo0J